MGRTLYFILLYSLLVFAGCSFLVTHSICHKSQHYVSVTFVLYSIDYFSVWGIVVLTIGPTHLRGGY